MAITVENARDLQKLSALKRQQNMQRLKELADKPPETVLLLSMPGSNSIEPFQVETVTRARAQMKELQDAIDEALENRDWKAAKGFSDALEKLSELERKLAGRPLPGQMKPLTQKPPKRTPLMEIAPQPKP